MAVPVRDRVNTFEPLIFPLVCGSTGGRWFPELLVSGVCWLCVLLFSNGLGTTLRCSWFLRMMPDGVSIE